MNTTRLDEVWAESGMVNGVVGFAGCLIAWLSLLVLFDLLCFRCYLLLLLFLLSWLLIEAGSVLTERLVRAAAVHQQWHV